MIDLVSEASRSERFFDAFDAALQRPEGTGELGELQREWSVLDTTLSDGLDLD